MRQDEISLQILRLKGLLKKDDYKIIKCFEAQLLGEEMPYDYVSLIEERKTIRNELEALEIRKQLLIDSGKEEE